MTGNSRSAVIVTLLVVVTFFYAKHPSSALAINSFAAGLLQAVAAEENSFLKEVMPQADTFSAKAGRLRHFKAYKVDGQTGRETLIGFVFLTTDVEPMEWGYEGPIVTLVGMTTEGVIVGIKVLEHTEPYGYFSIELPSFSDQFKGKSILDHFSIGRDIDAVSRATITVTSATRAIKMSARRIAKQHLTQSQD